jgi:hypothetical protein
MVKERMLRLVSGSSSTEIKFDQLAEIMVPLPDEGDFELFIEGLQKISSDIEQTRSTLATKMKERDRMISDLYVRAK